MLTEQVVDIDTAAGIQAAKVEGAGGGIGVDGDGRGVDMSNGIGIIIQSGEIG